MELGHYCLHIVMNVVVCTCLVLSACKIFKQTKITDWFQVTIWILVLVTEILVLIDNNYFRYAEKNNNFKNSIGGSLNTANFIITAVLFWEFSWGLFQISIEVEERLSRQRHWFQEKHRHALNIMVLVLIFVSFLTSALYKNNAT